MNNLRTIEAHSNCAKLKNNEARPKFTGSYKNKSVHVITQINALWCSNNDTHNHQGLAYDLKCLETHLCSVYI